MSNLQSLGTNEPRHGALRNQKPLIRMADAALPVVLSMLFGAIGSMHLIHPTWFEYIVPNALPAHRVLVLISGVCEILGGIGALLPMTRRFSAWGLIALLVAVFPANINMALHANHFAALAPAWALWLRLPLQALIITGVAHAYLRDYP